MTPVVLRLLAVVLAAVALAGCGRLNRAATLNDTTQVSGTATQAAIQHALGKHGLSGARVSCAKAMIVNVDTRTSCTLTGAGSSGTVYFTFRTSGGKIDPASLTTS